MAEFIKKKQVKTFKVDECTYVNRYDFATDCYDIVGIEIDGKHGVVMNKVSTKTYCIISGSGKFNVDGKDYEVGEGDLISVKPNEWVEIIGEKLKIIEISNPPFNNDDEEWK